MADFVFETSIFIFLSVEKFVDFRSEPHQLSEDQQRAFPTLINAH